MRIFLIGFMGSGKTFLGKLLAQQKNIPFYDLDKIIEEEERKSVAAIFELFGEHYFREKEAAILRNIDRFSDAVIACGGGTACFFDNMAWMNKNGITVFLNANFESIIKNVTNDSNVRPLIIGKNEEELKLFIENKLEERKPFYNKAQIILQNEHLNEAGLTKLNSIFATQ